MNPFKILAIPFLAISLAACQKSDLPTDASFTDCKNCTFTYQEDARIEGFQVKDGNEVVFTYKNYWTGRGISNDARPNSSLLFEVPSGSTAFDYGKNEIVSDKVTYGVMCINCGVIPFEPVDGKISGKKLDNHRWLVEANVILKAVHTDTRDTMTFKQYFTRVP